MKRLIAISLAISLYGCYEGTEFKPVPIGPAGEGTAPTQSYRGAAPQQSVPPHPMMEDPDAETVDTSEEVWAESVDDAKKKCEQIAAARTKQGKTLVSVQGEPQLVFKGKYVCSFRGET